MWFPKNGRNSSVKISQVRRTASNLTFDSLLCTFQYGMSLFSQEYDTADLHSYCYSPNPAILFLKNSSRSLFLFCICSVNDSYLSTVLYSFPHWISSHLFQIISPICQKKIKFYQWFCPLKCLQTHIHVVCFPNLVWIPSIPGVFNLWPMDSPRVGKFGSWRAVAIPLPSPASKFPSPTLTWMMQ